MTELPQSEAQPSDVRFSIRALLLVMIGVAVAAAALGPYFRGLQPNERVPVAVLWGGTGLAVLALLAYHAKTRYRLEQEAGPKILVLEPRGRWIHHHRPWVTVLQGCFVIAFGLFQLLRVPEQSVFSMLLPGGLGALFITLGVVVIWWNQKVQLRVNGALLGLRFLRWSHTTAHRWQDAWLTIEGVDQRHHDTRFDVNVPLADRVIVEDMLAGKLIGRQRQLPERSLAGEVEAVTLPPIKISPSQNITWRALLVGLSFYMAVIITIVFRPWGSPTEEFMSGFFLGVVLLIGWGSYRRRSVSSAGAPLMRLLAGTDWRKTFAAVLIAIGAYYVAQHLPVINAIFDGALGAICGLGVATVFAMILLQRFDMCENGIVLMRWTYWPWDTIELSKWNRDGNGRLVLGSGVRRVIARVPRISARRWTPCLSKNLVIVKQTNAESSRQPPALLGIEPASAATLYLKPPAEPKAGVRARCRK